MIAITGSGEFLPGIKYADKSLFSTIDNPYVLSISTAAGKESIERQEYWKKLVKERGLKVYCFRHGFAWRIHTNPKYCNKISTRMAASLMGHSHETHIRSYGQWTPAGSVRNSIRDLLKD